MISCHNDVIVLAPISSSGISRWKCVENEGWFCFHELNSNKRFLCYDGWTGRLKCSEDEKGRNFSITLEPRGQGFVISMLYWFKARPIVISTDGFPKLAEDGQKRSVGVVWKCIKV